MNWNRSSRPAVGVSYWKSGSSYTQANQPNNLLDYRNCLEKMPGRSEIFNLIIDHVIDSYKKNDSIRIHELGCNSGYNLNCIRSALLDKGYDNIKFTGNDSWGEAIKLGADDFRHLSLTEKLSDQLFKDLIDGKEKIDILFSHSHLIHLIEEDLDLIPEAIRESVQCCFFFEDFDLTENLKFSAEEGGWLNEFEFKSEDLNQESRFKIKIFGDANMMSFIKKL